MYPTDYTAQRLHKAFHAASNQASGAERLFAHLQANGLPAALYATARAYCNGLTAEAIGAATAYQDHSSPGAACEQQRVGLGVMGKLQAA